MEAGLEYRNPIPAKANKASVAAFAEHVAKIVSFGPGDAIESIVSQIGGAISFRNPVGDEHPESMRVEPSRAFKIFLPSMTSLARDKFTIAHELGHLFLHFPLVQEKHPGDGMRATRWVDDNNPEQQRCEWEANWFAAAFIMPEQEFREAYGRGGIWEATARFGVSSKAAEVRAKSLNLD